MPGFRSDKLWKKVIASAYYIMGILMLFADWTMGLFWLSSPFVFFSFIDLIHHKKKEKPLKKALIPFLLSFALMITGLAAEGPVKKEVAQKQQMELEEQARIEEQEKLEEERKLKEQEKLEEERKLKEEERKKAEEEAERKRLEEEKKKQEEAAKKVEGEMKVHYLDVGQGDSILIHTKDVAMLIDTGDRGYGAGIVSYLKNQGVKKLDYLILTHPHADHIGGAVEVINAFDIDNIIMPKVSHTSQTFENLLTTIQSKGMKITTPNPGDEYKLGDAEFIILGPNSSSYDNLNNYSVVNKVIFGNTSFLFTGDAESQSESEILGGGLNLKADVLKVGHHGSDTSTTESFLKAVTPTHAVISCGKGNKYGHPDQSVLTRLGNYGIKVYRTDESGTIIATSDGKSITFDKNVSITKNGSSSKQKATPKQEAKPEQNQESKSESKQEAKTTSKQETKPASKPETDNVEEVYITNTGKKYHRGNCPSLKKSKIPISLEKAKKDGYEPCKRCHPPQ